MNEEEKRKRRHLIAGFITLVGAVIMLYTGMRLFSQNLSGGIINLIMSLPAFVAIVLLFLDNNLGGYLALILSIPSFIINISVPPTELGLLGAILLFVGGIIGSTAGIAEDMIDNGTFRDEEFFDLMQDYVQCCKSIAAMKEVIGLKSYLTHDPSSIEEDLNNLPFNPEHWMVHYKYRDVNFQNAEGIIITPDDEMHPGQQAENLRILARDLYEKYASLQRLEETREE
ncbi:MAG: hypothetical protein HWN65_20620 [Candidatus Helarchaeota archaeon]|nr:hypothetical protein [Candidatus Helarchaeota archaeon]